MVRRVLFGVLLLCAIVLSQNCKNDGCDGSDGKCCSTYGYCGDTDDYCSKAKGCVSGCWNDGGSTGDSGNGGSSNGGSGNGGDAGSIDDGDRPGNDIKTVLVKSAKGCQKKCKETDGCTAWAYDSCGKTQCWLKSSAGDLIPGASCRKSGVIGGSSTSGTGNGGSTGNSGNGGSTGNSGNGGSTGNSTSNGSGNGGSTGSSGNGGNTGKGQTACQKDNTLKITSVFENSTPELQYCWCSWQNDKHGVTAGFPGFTTRDGDALEMLTDYQKKYGNNNFTSIMGAIRAAVNTNNDVKGYCDAWKKECKLTRFKQAEVAYVDKQYYDNSQKVADKYKITSPLVRAMFYDTNIMQGDGGSQYDLSGIAKWTQVQKGYPDNSGASQLAWGKAFNDRRKWVFSHSPDGGWEGDMYRVKSWSYILANNDASMPGRTVKMLENGGQPMTVTCDN